MPTWSYSLSAKGMDELIADLEQLKASLPTKADELSRRLAELGYEVAHVNLSGHVFSGETLASLTVKHEGRGRYSVSAGSKALLFLEYGAGATYGYGHPNASEHGMGPGTYPGNGHWNDNSGWWFPTDDPDLAHHYDRFGQGWAHTYGNPPYAPMYNAAERIKEEVAQVAREVFQL